jgi:branched-chain amino acid aminotransferase
MLNIGMTPQEAAEVVLETLRHNNLREGYVRLVATRGVGDLGLDPSKCPKSTMFCIAAQIQLYPESLYETGMDVVTAATQRNNVNACNAKIKSLNYLNSVLAKIEAGLAGVSEAILLNSDGYVLECTGDNIFFVKKGRVITPPSYLGLLEGVTRNAVLESAVKLGYPAQETVFTRHDLYVADECFLTGTAAEMIPVVKVDGRPIGDGKPGPVTRALLKEFRKLTEIDGPEIFPR